MQISRLASCSINLRVNHPATNSETIFHSTLGKLVKANHAQVVISTGLLILENAHVTKSGNVISKIQSVANTADKLSVVSGQPLQTIYGISRRDLPYPKGTSQNLSIENFVPLETPLEDFSWSADVEGISTQLECEDVHLLNTTRVIGRPWDSILAPFYVTNVTTPTCNLTDVLVGEGLSHDPTTIDVSQQYQGWWGNYTCNDGLASDAYPPGERPMKPGFDDHRFLATTSLVQWTTSLPRDTWIEKFTMIICKASYSIDKYSVTMQQNTGDTWKTTKLDKLPNTSRKISGLEDADLVPLLKNISSLTHLTSNSSLVDPDSGPSEVTIKRRTDTFFDLMVQILEAPGLEALQSQGKLREVAPKAFEGVMTQFFAQNLEQHAAETIFGSISYSEPRLQAKRLTVALMVTFLGLVAGVSIVLAFICPHDAVSRDPSTIGAKASFMASSPSLRNQLIETGLIAGDEKKSPLRNDHYYSSISSDEGLQSFSIVKSGTSNGAGLASPSEPAGSNGKWWRPFWFFNFASVLPHAPSSKVWWRPRAAHLWLVGIATILPLMLIAILQTIQHASDIHNGFMDAPDTKNNRQVLTHYIPAAVLLCVALLHSSLQFAATLFAPFILLKRGPNPASRSISMSLVGKLPLHTLLISARQRLLAPSLSLLAVIVGSFLSIVASGLYTFQDVPLSQIVEFQSADYFDFGKTNLYSNDSLAGTTASLIRSEDLPYPQWTHYDLIFPKFRSATSDSSYTRDVSLHSTLRITIPALRPKLECMTVPPANVYSTGIGGTNYFSSNSISINYQANISWPCVLYGNTASSSSQTLSMVLSVPIDGETKMIGASTTPSWSIQNGESDLKDVTMTAGCPTLFLSFGTASAQRENATANLDESNVSQNASINFFLCYQLIEEVDTEVTFELPGMAISATESPRPLEHTARYLNFTSEAYRGPIYGARLDTLWNNLPDDTSTATYYVSPFLKNLVHGKEGRPLEAFLGDAGAAKLIRAANELYATYMVQAFNENARVDGQLSSAARDAQQNVWGAADSYAGNMTRADRQRIKQDSAVKWALQGMLAFMAISAIAVYVLNRDTKALLPNCPCSIAGTMSLLAGSEMASRNLLPAGNEWNKQVEDDAIWAGWLFSLGWWGPKERRRYGIDVGRADAEQEIETRQGEEAEDPERTRQEDRHTPTHSTDNISESPAAIEPTTEEDAAEETTNENIHTADGTIEHDTLENDTLENDILEHDTLEDDTLEHNTPGHDTTGHITTEYDTIDSISTEHSPVDAILIEAAPIDAPPVQATPIQPSTTTAETDAVDDTRPNAI